MPLSTMLTVIWVHCVGEKTTIPQSSPLPRLQWNAVEIGSTTTGRRTICGYDAEAKVGELNGNPSMFDPALKM